MLNELRIKSAVVFKLLEPVSQEELNNALKAKACAFMPCPSNLLSSHGFDQDEATGEAVIDVNGLLLASFVTESKNIPASVVKIELQKYMKANNIEKFKNKGERESARDDIFAKLIPRAFVKQRREYILIDNDKSRLYILNASAHRVQMISFEIRKALGSIKITHLINCESLSNLINNESLSNCLTDWVRNPENIPSGLEIGSTCKAVEAEDNRSSVKVNKIELNHDEIIEALGVRKVVELEAIFKESLVMMIKANGNFMLSGLKVIGDDAEILKEYDDIHDRVKAQVALTMGNISELIDVLVGEC